MVKVCEKTSHTHDAENSNYASAVEGLDEVLAYVREQRPWVIWENVENGGQMMTFKMVQQYDTSIICDDMDTIPTREAIYGATYPFSLRYTARYMRVRPTLYTTRSSMFGGPWILMQRLTELSSSERSLLKSEIARYKNMRQLFRSAKVFHLRPVLGGAGWDAISAIKDKAEGVIFVFRGKGGNATETFYPKGLNNDRVYRITFADRADVIVRTGADLKQNGISVSLPSESSEIITITAEQ